MDLICFGQGDWDGTWTEKQQHCVRLARRGHRVLYVDRHASTDVRGVVDAARALAPATTRLGVREVEERTFVLTHRHAPWLGWRLNDRRWPRVLRATARRLGFRAPTALAYYPEADVLMDAVSPAVRAYYAVDEMSAFGERPESERAAIRAREAALLRRTRVAFGVSPRLVARFREHQPNAHLLENGVDPDHFAPARLATLDGHPAIAALPRPRLGLVGQIDERVDQTLLLAVARARPAWQIVLVGRVKAGVDVGPLASEPNVHLVPFQPYARLPHVLRELDVCLVPYHRTPLTQACNPSKIFEYVAAGRPVVATPLEGIVACRPVVALADTVAAFVDAAEAALAEPPEAAAARLALARASDWERRTDVLEARLLEAAAAPA